MAGPDTIVSRLGQVNGAGADDALFLKQFSGEILTEFEQATVFKSRHFVRQISNGKTAQFPLIGTVVASMHTPGQWIDGQQVDAAEIDLSVDGLLIAPVFVASIDELENHYDVRGPYATEMGRQLAYQYDNNVARTFILGARSASPLTGRPGGSVIKNTAFVTNSDTLVGGIFTAAQTLDEKNVGSEGRNGFFAPAQFYQLVQNKTLLDIQFRGSSNISTGVVDTAAGVQIVKTNHLPKTNLTADATVLAKYKGDFSSTVGLVASMWGAGTVQLMDISIDSEFEIRRQGTFMIAKMATGHGILRAECAVELSISAT